MFLIIVSDSDVTTKFESTLSQARGMLLRKLLPLPARVHHPFITREPIQVKASLSIPMPAKAIRQDTNALNAKIAQSRREACLDRLP